MFRPARALSLLGFLSVVATVSGKGIEFAVSYPASAWQGPFDGKVVVYLSRTSTQPRFGPDWFHPEPVVVAAFRKVQPGQAMRLSSANILSKPGSLARLAPGTYSVQAVIDRNLGGRNVGTSPGNLFSDAKQVDLDPAKDAEVTLVCDKVAPAPVFRDTDRVKGVKLLSPLLSGFYGRATYLTAAVGLPEEWSKEPARRFPVVFVIPGFGGTPWVYSGASQMMGTRKDGEPFIVVQLDADCPTGHSVFADSANNGPWGAALVKELVPYVEKTYRGVGQPWARYVNGHSSGGWSSLWLQVAYPDFFGGVWSTSPDPVDFRAFQGIDLYKPRANMFTDEKGAARPLARIGDTVAITYRAFSDREWGLRGEQLGSFEAVFSPRGVDGETQKLWSRSTGAIDPKVAAAWRNYDIGLILRTRWKELGPKLKGKIFVICGSEDTFYLDSAVKLLQKDLRTLGSDATVELLPGDHGSVMTWSLVQRIEKGMADRYRAGAKRHAAG